MKHFLLMTLAFFSQWSLASCYVDLAGPMVVCSNQQNVTFKAVGLGMPQFTFPPNVYIQPGSKLSSTVTVNFNGTPPGDYWISASGRSLGCLKDTGVAISIKVVDNSSGICTLSPITNALSFDGVDDYVKIPAYPEIANIGSQDFTIEARVKVSATTNSYPSIVSNRASGGFLLLINPSQGGKPWLNMNNINYPCSGCPSFMDNQCHMLSVRGSSGNLYYYVDGVLVTTRPYSPVVGTGGDLYIGKDLPGYSTNFKGDISEIRIWNIARNPADIATYANKTLPITSSTGLVGYWRLNEGFGNRTFNTQLDYYDKIGLLGGQMYENNSNPAWTNSCAGIPKKPGSSFEAPFYVGHLTRSSSYQDTRNNNPASGFEDDYGQYASDDIVYKFSISNTCNVNMELCNSIVTDTYMRLYDENRKLILFNDDGGIGYSCSNNLRSAIKVNLKYGSYYLVVEGFHSGHNGDITTTITSTVPDNGPVYGRLAQADDTKDSEKDYASPSTAYPNPVKGETLFLGRHATQYRLLNIAGNVVAAGENQDQIQIGALPSGLYILQIDGQIEKIVIE